MESLRHHLPVRFAHERVDEIAAGVRSARTRRRSPTSTDRRSRRSRRSRPPDAGR